MPLQGRGLNFRYCLSTGTFLLQLSKIGAEEKESIKICCCVTGSRMSLSGQSSAFVLVIPRQEITFYDQTGTLCVVTKPCQLSQAASANHPGSAPGTRCEEDTEERRTFADNRYNARHKTCAKRRRNKVNERRAYSSGHVHDTCLSLRVRMRTALVRCPINHKQDS